VSDDVELHDGSRVALALLREFRDDDGTLAAEPRVHPYDESYEAASEPWVAFVSISESRAPTKPISPATLSNLTERCKEEETAT
jgi:hypothetical protein